MPGCAAIGCNNKSSGKQKSSNVTFHKFPSNEVQRQKWIQAVRRKGFIPTKYTSLCSSHFNEEDIDRTSLSCVRIRNGAVPSVFDAFPSYLKTNKTKRKPPKQRAPAAAKKSLPTENCTDSVMPAVTDDNVSPPRSPAASTSNGCNADTPVKTALKRKLVETEQKVLASRKKIKLLQQSKRRLLKRQAKLTDVIKSLRKQDILSTDSMAVLEVCGGGVSDLLERVTSKNSDKAVPRTYSPQLRSFALTLHFYSPRAYNYVRKMFATCLPHPRTIRKWYQSVEDGPGFNAIAFKALQTKTMQGQGDQNSIPCALVMDEMTIRRHVEWDGQRFQGRIDMGTELDDDMLPEAKEAIVLMVVSIKSSWKLPIGYFFIDGLCGEERKNLVLDALSRLHDVGIDIISITHDGPPPNIAMLKGLGVDLSDPSNIKPHFPHPSTNYPVVAFLDPCHMLKLVRNTLAEKKSIFYQHDEVKWQYFVDLNNLQDREGLHLGNKLRNAHVAWQKKKMNVRLAAQTFSESVATSLEFCLGEKIQEFDNCEATIKFIRMFNILFDMLNSRNLNSGGWKRPFQTENAIKYASFLSEAKSYILSLRLSKSGPLILNSNRKTGFLGFLLCIESLLSLYETLIAPGKYGLSFILSYKFSQDHIELFFGQVRSMGGCNNNPTVQQFKSAFKKLLIHNNIQDVERGNCLSLESVPILTVSSKGTELDNEVPSVSAINLSPHNRSRLNESSEDNSPCHVVVPSITRLSVCSENIVAYIAGFVVFRLSKHLKCETCVGALVDSNVSNITSLLFLKSRGGLTVPSNDVIEICLVCEKLFRCHVASTSEGDMTLSNVKCHKLVQSVLKAFLQKPIFDSLRQPFGVSHQSDC